MKKGMTGNGHIELLNVIDITFNPGGGGGGGHLGI